jgi:hypothetical protein
MLTIASSVFLAGRRPMMKALLLRLAGLMAISEDTMIGPGQRLRERC